MLLEYLTYRNTYAIIFTNDLGSLIIFWNKSNPIKGRNFSFSKEICSWYPKRDN